MFWVCLLLFFIALILSDIKGELRGIREALEARKG
jgi:hypothetical protein